MILEAIRFIQLQLGAVNCVAANIGDIVTSAADLPPGTDPGIILSLVNIEENRISKDPRNYIKAGTDIQLKNPAVHLNLTLLFSAFPRLSYENALANLQTVIGFFQHKYVFDHSNSGPELDPGIEKLILEMVTINMEQLNHLWSIMGGRYQPSVVYKMRMITIDSLDDKGGSLIKEIETNYHLITPDE